MPKQPLMSFEQIQKPSAVVPPLDFNQQYKPQQFVDFSQKEDDYQLPASSQFCEQPPVTQVQTVHQADEDDYFQKMRDLLMQTQNDVD